jgi:hypothetical protein
MKKLTVVPLRRERQHATIVAQSDLSDLGFPPVLKVGKNNQQPWRHPQGGSGHGHRCQSAKIGISPSPMLTTMSSWSTQMATTNNHTTCESKVFF